MNHTERIAYVARQNRRLTRNLVRDAVELYLETLAEDIVSGEWVDLPGIGKVQVMLERASGTLYPIQGNGNRQARKPHTRLRTKIRLNTAFKIRCRATLIR
jgi:nucleoid DNA-binding protein